MKFLIVKLSPFPIPLPLGFKYLPLIIIPKLFELVLQFSRDYVSQLRSTSCNIIVLYILVFKILRNKLIRPTILI